MTKVRKWENIEKNLYKTKSLLYKRYKTSRDKHIIFLMKTYDRISKVEIRFSVILFIFCHLSIQLSKINELKSSKKISR